MTGAAAGPPGAPGARSADRAFFDCAPTPMAEHDYSAVRARLDTLPAGGVEDLGAYLLARPPLVAELAREVRVLDVNAAWVALAGARTREEATGTLDRFLGVGSLPAFARALASLVEGGRRVEAELAFRALDGREPTVVARASPLPGSERSLAHVLVGLVDVTERKKGEQRLHESEALLRASQWIAGLGHYVLDVAGGTWSGSDALDDLLGVGPDYPRTTEGWLALIHPGDRQAVREYLAFDVLAARRPFDRLYRIVRPGDGATRWVRGRGELALAANGVPVRMTGIVQDVTELHEASEERVRLAERMRHAARMESLGRLAGGVAHDFNNMLAVILGHVDLALKRPAVRDDLRDDLTAAKDAATRSAELTRQLLRFARQQPIRPRPLDLGAAVAGMARMLEKLATERVRLEVRLAPDLWPTSVDPSQVDQVITNLVANARDAIEGAGTIRIETSNATIDEPHAERIHQVAAGEYAALTVVDSGAGMDDATLRHLFEPFFTTKSPGRGTGLGLATVYGIVRQNRGGIEVRSAPGQGTAFRVFFPRHDDGGDQEPTAPPARDGSPRGSEHVLVVEDEPSVLNVLRRSLEACGYRVLASATSAEALGLLRSSENTIDLLVADVGMPEMSGRDLAAAAAGLRPGLRALLLSGHATEADRGGGTSDGRVDLLPKPFTPAALALRVRELLDRR